MNREKYLQRINYHGALDTSFATLVQLQKVHLLSVPFENLDIHHNTPIILDLDWIYTKIVDRNRGGFCYELNGLFHELLTDIGFQVKRVSARVYNDQQELSPEYDHMALIVRLDDTDYLVDVGFGRFAFGPLKLQLGIEQQDSKGLFQMDKYDDAYWRVSKKRPNGWNPEYIFTLTERALHEYAGMCHYHQTSQDSLFLKSRMCSMPTETGRITVSGNKVLIDNTGQKTEMPIPDEAAFHQYLWKYFKVKI